MKVKNHTTITITLKMLRDMNACKEGLDNIKHLLPMTISTDPEKNHSLACEIADTPRAFTSHTDVIWLVNMVLGGNTFDMWPYDMLADTGYGNPMCDAWVVGQQLAAIADCIATREGR